MSAFHLSRRRFIGNTLGLLGAAALPLYGYYSRFPRNNPSIQVHRPGMQMGHYLRDKQAWPKPSKQMNCDVLIIGSGAAALTAAWKLSKENVKDFLLIEGPEPDGNNAGMSYQELSYPTGAHYLALPTKESFHVREMLTDLGVLQKDPDSDTPTYDERVLVHAQEERLLKNDVWQDHLLPENDSDSQRFFQQINNLSNTKGNDGKRIFVLPSALSSQDPKWRALDRQTFAQWLKDNHYSSPDLLWYLNYCCQDDYGQGIHQVSAWAGLHYFASHNAHAKHAEHAVLVWPNGLANISAQLREKIQFKRINLFDHTTHDHMQTPLISQGSALNITEHDTHVEVLIGTHDLAELKTMKIHAKKIICAAPLYISSHIVSNIEQYGFVPTEHLPVYAPWLVSNFVLNRFPQEKSGTPLAWDNVIHQGKGLGYVVSTHQLIRVARPELTAFTTYHALDSEEPALMRAWLLNASEEELLNLAVSDLRTAYAEDFWHYVQHVDISVRAHAMACPHQGFLHNKGLQNLQAQQGRVLFAHSDLSGFSVFEEASWWGYQAALRLLSA
ncbi:NAD(P)-binding protein [Neisseria sp. Ec49-e6-T10]|uniref:NAD(P)-binding protein n=1 Tax=Neisseria sp. Ec49-e6-T10 TaxID=3140744 RepID=UPI003EBBF144